MFIRRNKLDDLIRQLNYAEINLTHYREKTERLEAQLQQERVVFVVEHDLDGYMGTSEVEAVNFTSNADCVEFYNRGGGRVGFFSHVRSVKQKA